MLYTLADYAVSSQEFRTSSKSLPRDAIDLRERKGRNKAQRYNGGKAEPAKNHGGKVIQAPIGSEWRVVVGFVPAIKLNSVSRNCPLASSNGSDVDSPFCHYLDPARTGCADPRRAVVRRCDQKNLLDPDANAKAAKKEERGRDKNENADTNTDPSKEIISEAISDAFTKKEEDAVRRSAVGRAITWSEEKKDCAHAFTDRFAASEKDSLSIATAI